MDNRYSDSLFPFGIGEGFVLVLLVPMLTGAIVGLLLGEDHPISRVGGGLLIAGILLITLGGPIIYNKKASRFEQGRSVLKEFNGWGNVPGLRGASVRLLLYEHALEIRAFYHRYLVPFTEIKKISLEKTFLAHQLKIQADNIGLPEFIACTGDDFAAFGRLVMQKAESWGRLV